ncbi:MAG: tyrosine-type recombinase/integrase [Pseudomonadota bacterium]
MAGITVKELQALVAADNGRRVSMGQSMYGSVRAGRDGVMSVYVVWRYKVGGKLRQAPIGTWKDKGGRSLKSLRDERDQMAALLKTGIDPLERKTADKLKVQVDQIEALHQQFERMESLAEKKARLTVRGLFELWKNLALKQRRDSGSEASRAFERDVFPAIGDMAAMDVEKAHIQKIVDTMMLRDVVRMTKRVLSDLRQMFGFALDRDLITTDPTARIRKASIGKDVERDRVLSEREVTLLIAKLPDSGLAFTSRAALLIQLSTLTRIGEVVAARWEDVDFELRRWTLPETKNGKSHKVWLSDFALRQFVSLRAVTGATEWMFPNSKIDGPLNSKTTTKQVADRQRDGTPMSNRTQQTDALMLPGGHWRPHDLRRTGASIMAELGALPDIIERCLNHTEENKMKRIYQRAAYEGPMQDAWRLWGERLDLLSQEHNNRQPTLYTSG